MKRRMTMLSLAFSVVLGLAALAAPVKAEAATKITVNANSQIEGKYVNPPKNIQVSSDLAESYGYQDKITDGVSTLDVLVAETERMFGDAFTKDSADKYLVVSDSGWITTVFGQVTGNIMFYIGTESPYTTVDATQVAANDSVTFYMMQDTTGWLDSMTYFEGAKTQTMIMGAKKELTLKASLWGSIRDAAGADVGIVDIKTGKITKIGTTNAQGKITVSFAKAGDYYVTAYGSDESGSPLIMNPVLIKVESITTTLSKSSYTYNGNACKPSLTVKYNGKTLTKNVDYTYSYKNNINAGTASVVVTLKGSYAGQATKTYTINKAKQTIKTKVTKKTVKKATLAKKAVSFDLSTKVLGGAKVTYVSKSKKLTVSTKGKVTVKKGTAKGTYKVIVKALSSKNYLPASKTITVIVK